MSVVEIKIGDLVLARHVPAEIAWTPGLHFYSQDEEYIQAGVWVYPAGKKLSPHIHNEAVRQVEWTQEVIFVRRGRILARIYDTNERRVADLEIRSGDILMLLRGGHGYDVLDDGTEVLEVKNGPYVGAERDRRRI